RMGQHRRARQPHERRAVNGERTDARRADFQSATCGIRARGQYVGHDTRHDCQSHNSSASARAAARFTGVSKALIMISRRVFLKNGSFALVSLGFAPSFLARTALAAGPTRRSKKLIAIFQRGAVDGLSVIVPYGENEYYRARPTIAIGRPRSGDAGTVDLDGFFGFNPRLTPLKPLWDRCDLAIVHACGSPDATRSHFDAQDYMETATPGIKSTGDGWLNRYLQTRQAETESSFRAVALTSQLPRML